MSFELQNTISLRNIVYFMTDIDISKYSKNYFRFFLNFWLEDLDNYINCETSFLLHLCQSTDISLVQTLYQERTDLRARYFGVQKGKNSYPLCNVCCLGYSIHSKRI